MSFVNTLPYISNPIEEFSDFKFCSWERDIYPKFKAGVKASEIEFFTKLIRDKGAKKILDLGVGGGVELSGILEDLEKQKYALTTAEANEVDENFITQAKALFEAKQQDVKIHKANWLDLPKATPEYSTKFDFAYLTGNSLTYIGGGSREYTKSAQQSIVSKFAELIEPGGYLFIESRNYDYIRSLMNLPKSEIFKNFTFDYTVYYHGFQDTVTVFPAYISETVVVLHYYDKQAKIWSKLDLYPIYQNDMREILGKDFELEAVYHDFGAEQKEKSLFVQYLARRK